MRVSVSEIQNDGGRTMVKAESALGSMWGVWHFRETPTAGCTYQIEFTFNNNDPYDADDVAILKEAAAGFSTDGKSNTFTAECEDTETDPDGTAVIYLRFAADGLEMLAVTEKGNIGAGSMLRFTLPCDMVGIYPYL